MATQAVNAALTKGREKRHAHLRGNGLLIKVRELRGPIFEKDRDDLIDLLKKVETYEASQQRAAS